MTQRLDFLPSLFLKRKNVCDSATEMPYWWRKICLESGNQRWLDDRVVTLLTKGRQKTKDYQGQMLTWRTYNKTVNICEIYCSFEFCWSSFADKHNALPKLTRRNINLNKFAFETPGLSDILCKHWFTCTSSVWNFCHWVTHVPPRETSPVARSEEKQLRFRRLSFWHLCSITAGMRVEVEVLTILPG